MKIEKAVVVFILPSAVIQSDRPWRATKFPIPSDFSQFNLIQIAGFRVKTFCVCWRTFVSVFLALLRLQFDLWVYPVSSRTCWQVPKGFVASFSLVKFWFSSWKYVKKYKICRCCFSAISCCPVCKPYSVAGDPVRDRRRTAGVRVRAVSGVSRLQNKEHELVAGPVLRWPGPTLT
mgnify:CR=1 FL=1